MKTGFGWAFASAMLLGSIGSAVAADMPMKAMPMRAPPVAVYNWTGFYIGGSVGGIWNDTRSDTYPTGCFISSVTCGGGVANNPIRSDSVRLNDSRFIGGGQAGFNWQNGRFVGGVEGDISWTGLNQAIITSKTLSAPLAGVLVHGDGMKQDWLATLRARAGFTLAPQFLLYATGGLAFGHVQAASAVAFTTTADTYAGSYDDTRFGWTVGAGGEWMITQNWSVKAEYLYVDLGKQGINLACTAPGVCTSPPQVAPGATYQSDYRFHENIARVGLNYHFGGPVVARY